MKELEQQKVGQIVASNFRTSKVFTSYGIDFCCKGGVTLKAACDSRGLNLEKVTQELLESNKVTDDLGYEQIGIKPLVTLILDVHHHYVRTTMPALSTYLQKLCDVHGERHPELYEISKLFEQTTEALETHMKKEELILFPYLIAMEEALEGGFPLSMPHFGSIENPIHMMEEDHKLEGSRFEHIAELSHQFTPPEDGCQTYRVAFSLLQEFQEDLHRHIHLENNLLFPLSRKLFEELQPH